MATGVNRIHILGVPLDVVEDKNLPTAIEQLKKNDSHGQIILLDFHEFMRSRISKERKAALETAALVFPVSRLICWASKFTGEAIPPLRRPYPFVIRLLGILESKRQSVYLLGSSMKGVRSAESTLRATFPGLHIVGRYASRFPKDRENDVVTAIKKSSPALLLAGKGLKGRHLWLSRRKPQLNSGLSLWERSCFDVFSGKRNKPSYSRGVLFFKNLFSTVFLPWRIFRLFRYMWFFLLVLVERIRK